MFEATTGATRRGRRSPMATILSIGLHALAVVIVVMIGRKTVVAEALPEVEVTFFSAPPPPPPPPPPASSTTKKKKKKKKPKVEKQPDPTPQELVQPTEIPEEIPEVEEPDVEETDDEEVADAGVVGGVEGGVAGGVVGGVVGGVEGGVVGGDINSVGKEAAEGRCKNLGKPRYPDMAREMQIEGRVELRVVIDETGKVMKAKDERCTWYADADRSARRKSWHPRLCIEALEGPEALVFDTLMHYAGMRCQPWVDQGQQIPFQFKPTVNYSLQ